MSSSASNISFTGNARFVRHSAVVRPIRPTPSARPYDARSRAGLAGYLYGVASKAYMTASHAPIDSFPGQFSRALSR